MCDEGESAHAYLPAASALEEARALRAVLPPLLPRNRKIERAPASVMREVGEAALAGKSRAARWGEARAHLSLGQS